MTKTPTPIEQPLSQPDDSSGQWHKVAEHTLDHLYAPIDGDTTRLDAMRAHYIDMGAQAVTISMNGHNSQEANAWNSDNTRMNGPAGDNVYSVLALLPPTGHQK